MSMIDRRKFFRDLKKVIKKYDIKSVRKIPVEAKIVVVRVEDFDLSSNDVWHIEANKSYPREGLVCHDCGHVIVMSGATFEMYSANPVPNQIFCHRCVFNI